MKNGGYPPSGLRVPEASFPPYEPDPGHRSVYTGCSLNIVFFSEDFRIFRTLASVFPRCQCV